MSAAYKMGKMFFYDHASLHKTFTVGRNFDKILYETIDAQQRSMKGLLLLFVEQYSTGTLDSKKFFNPNIASVKVLI